MKQPLKRVPAAGLGPLFLALGRLGSRAAFDAIEVRARAIVFAPHPDDEVLGCGGTIALKKAAGAEVRVVVMTDGRASHAGLIDADSLIRMRRDEAARAAPHLGLDAADYRFLDFEDDCLRDHAEQARLQVVELLVAFGPAQVFVPHRRDRLSDHVATFEIVRSALDGLGTPVTMFEYPVWLWHTWPWTTGKPHSGSGVRAALRLLRDVAELAFGCRAHVDVRAVLQRKQAALAEYGSQVRRFQADPRWPVLSDVSDGAFLGRFETDLEVFRETRFLR